MLVCAWLLGGALQAARPSIYPDELVYLQLQQSFGLHGHFALFGHPFSALSYGPALPALLAPLARLGLAPVPLYRLDILATSLLYASAIAPAYLLARRLLPARAVLATALVALVPSSFLATRFMTEALAYPLFLWLVLALWRLLERPDGRRRLQVLLLIVLAVLTRAQFVALVPVYVC